MESKKVHHYRCPGCNANQVFEPVDGTLTCPYCERKEQIPVCPEEVQERSYEQYLREQNSNLVQIAEHALEVACDGCGAVVNFVPPEVANDCSFCGRHLIAQPVSAHPLIGPEGIFPFAVAREEATRIFAKWLGELWFAPNSLKKTAKQKSLDGVYLPYWTYDSYSVTHYQGERGDNYYDTETYLVRDASGRTTPQVRQVVKTRWSPVSGMVDAWFDEVMVPSTTSVPREKLLRLEPWDVSSLVAYSPAYLSGFKAQRYQLKMPECFEAAKEQMSPMISQMVRQDIGGDHQRVYRLATSYSGITFKHVLVPVYLVAYQFGDRVFQVIVNGRTGEIHGDRPYSVVKIVLALVFGLGSVFGGLYYAETKNLLPRNLHSFPYQGGDFINSTR